MGTRNLVIMRIDGQVKLAKYCQWDGVPTWQGRRTIIGLKRYNSEQLKENLRCSVFIDNKQAEDRRKKTLALDQFKNTIELENKLKEMFIELSRDSNGFNLFQELSKRPLESENAISFLKEFDCEWAWEVDFDKELINIYADFAPSTNEEIGLLATYSFNDLPDYQELERLEALEYAEDEDY